MSVEIVYLKDHENFINELVEIWETALGIHMDPATNNAQWKRAKLHTANNIDKLPIGLVALYEDQPAGFCVLKTIQETHNQTDLLYLSSVCIKESLRQFGIGTMLVKKAITEAIKTSYEGLYLFALNARLVRWYEALNFQVIGIKTWYDGDKTPIMKLDLTH